MTMEKTMCGEARPHSMIYKKRTTASINIKLRAHSHKTYSYIMLQRYLRGISPSYLGSKLIERPSYHRIFLPLQYFVSYKRASRQNAMKMRSFPPKHPFHPIKLH